MSIVKNQCAGDPQSCKPHQTRHFHRDVVSKYDERHVTNLFPAVRLLPPPPPPLKIITLPIFPYFSRIVELNPYVLNFNCGVALVYLYHSSPLFRSSLYVSLSCLRGLNHSFIFVSLTRWSPYSLFVVGVAPLPH